MQWVKAPTSGALEAGHLHDHKLRESRKHDVKCDMVEPASGSNTAKEGGQLMVCTT